MYQFYFIKNIKKQIAAKSRREIVSKMRQHEWKGKSTNSDYMHVFASRMQNNFNNIRFNNEDEFIEDLISFGIVKQIDIVTFVGNSITEKMRITN